MVDNIKESFDHVHSGRDEDSFSMHRHTHKAYINISHRHTRLGIEGKRDSKPIWDKYFIINKEKQNTFTREQKEYLLEIAHYMNDEFGVSKEQLSPLYQLIYIDMSPLTEEQIKQGKIIAEKLNKKDCIHNFMLRSECCNSIQEKGFIDVCDRCRALANWVNVCEFCGKKENE